MGVTTDFTHKKGAALMRQLARSVPKETLVIQGPKNKSAYTYALESVVRAFILNQIGKSEQGVDFFLEDEVLFAKVDELKINISDILEHVNYGHISLNDNFDLAYEEFVLSGKADHTPIINDSDEFPNVEGIPSREDYLKREKASKYPNALENLTWSEKTAINIYTGGFYSTCNNLMRGSLDEIENFSSQKIGETLTLTALICSGLNRASPIEPVYTFRIQEFFSEQYLKTRVNSVRQGGLLTNERAFMSTAFDMIEDESFSEMTYEGIKEGVATGIMYTNTQGKYIYAIAIDHFEMEYLMPPTQMRWVGYHQTANGGYVFHATPANVIEHEALQSKDRHCSQEAKEVTNEHIQTEMKSKKELLEKENVDPNNKTTHLSKNN